MGIQYPAEYHLTLYGILYDCTTVYYYLVPLLLAPIRTLEYTLHTVGDRSTHSREYDSTGSYRIYRSRAVYHGFLLSNDVRLPDEDNHRESCI